jgi:hypothetical protein
MNCFDTKASASSVGPFKVNFLGKIGDENGKNLLFLFSIAFFKKGFCGLHREGDLHGGFSQIGEDLFEKIKGEIFRKDCQRRSKEQRGFVPIKKIPKR